jgi:replicative DNA helicase
VSSALDIKPPHSAEAEWSVIANMLTKPQVIAEVIGAQVGVEDFFRPDCRLIFEQAVENYYADSPVDAVTIGERLRAPLARQWSVDDTDVANRLWEQSSARAGGDALGHARLVKNHALSRRLLQAMQQAAHEIANGEKTPEEIGDTLGTEATKIITGTKKRGEIMTFREVGEEYIRYLQRLKLAREQGIELAAYFGLKFADDWIKGLAPGEVLIIGGEPGVGKSALTWGMGTGFAKRQLPRQKKIGTLVLSMEMPLIGSSGRVATAITDIEADRLREGIVSDDELSLLIKNWQNLEHLPIYWNFAANFRFSQMRALIVEAIRRHNVGLVIIDHFRMFDPDRRINNANQEDEAKARFLKEDIAKDLNVAVICLAHTVKTDSERNGGRPRLRDLRGSGQVAAHADIVAFMYRPYMHADEDDKLDGLVKVSTSELIYEKNRSGALGTADFVFVPEKMTVRDPYTGEL